MDFLELRKSLIKNARKERKCYSPGMACYSMACGHGPGWSRQDAGGRDEFVGASGHMKENISDC